MFRNQNLLPLCPIIGICALHRLWIRHLPSSFTCPPKNITTELFRIYSKKRYFFAHWLPCSVSLSHSLSHVVETLPLGVDRIAEERVDDSLVHFGSFENETLLICIIYIQEKLHHSIPNADTGLPWCTWCWNFSLVYSFNIKLQVSGSTFTVSQTRGQGSFYSGKISHEF